MKCKKHTHTHTFPDAHNYIYFIIVQGCLDRLKKKNSLSNVKKILNTHTFPDAEICPPPPHTHTTDSFNILPTCPYLHSRRAKSVDQNIKHLPSLATLMLHWWNNTCEVLKVSQNNYDDCLSHFMCWQNLPFLPSKISLQLPHFPLPSFKQLPQIAGDLRPVNQSRLSQGWNDYPAGTEIAGA